MTLKEYYDIIVSKYQSGDFTISKETESTIIEKEFPLYAIDYLIFEYLKDNQDDRWELLLDYVLVPNGVNKGDCDIDFTKVSFEEFFYFMVSVKN